MAAYIVDNVYKVYIAKTGKYTHIRIRRIDDKPISNFKDFQAIKKSVSRGRSGGDTGLS